MDCETLRSHHNRLVQEHAASSLPTPRSAPGPSCLRLSRTSSPLLGRGILAHGVPRYGERRHDKLPAISCNRPRSFWRSRTREPRSIVESTVRYLGIEVDDALEDLRADGDLRPSWWPSQPSRRGGRLKCGYKVRDRLKFWAITRRSVVYRGERPFNIASDPE